jgi:osmotically-inducible protein OsmY
MKFMLVMKYDKRGEVMIIFKKNATILGYVVMACGLALLTAAKADYPNKNPRSSYNESHNRSEKLESKNNPDQDLGKKIRDKIGSGWFTKGYDEVEVQVRNGNVMLQGTVKTPEDREKVEKEVHNIDGVRSVNNQIRIQNPNYK